MQAYSDAGYDPYFIQTEFEIMQSEKVLGRVIESLDLNNKWGKKYNGGTPLKTEDTMQLLKQRMSLTPERNTKLIDITVYSEDKADAARLANGIAVAYQEYRWRLRNTNMLKGIAVYDKEFQEEEDSIQAVQTNVDQLRKELNIIDTDPQSTGSKSDAYPGAIAAIYKDQQIERGKGLHEESRAVGRVAVVAGDKSGGAAGRSAHDHFGFRP